MCADRHLLGRTRTGENTKERERVCERERERESQERGKTCFFSRKRFFSSSPSPSLFFFCPKADCLTFFPTHTLVGAHSLPLLSNISRRTYRRRARLTDLRTDGRTDLRSVLAFYYFSALTLLLKGRTKQQESACSSGSSSSAGSSNLIVTVSTTA